MAAISVGKYLDSMSLRVRVAQPVPGVAMSCNPVFGLIYGSCDHLYLRFLLLVDVVSLELSTSAEHRWGFHGTCCWWQKKSMKVYAF